MSKELAIARKDWRSMESAMKYSKFEEVDHPRDSDGKFSTYYRIQPSGMGLDHTSETSNGTTTGLHVFETPSHVFGSEGHPHDYGDEVVEIESPNHKNNGDVEGVEIDPSKSRITRRWSTKDFPSAVAPWLKDLSDDDFDPTYAYKDLPHWHALKNRHSEFEMTPDDEEPFHLAVPKDESK